MERCQDCAEEQTFPGKKTPNLRKEPVLLDCGRCERRKRQSRRVGGERSMRDFFFFYRERYWERERRERWKRDPGKMLRVSGKRMLLFGGFFPGWCMEMLLSEGEFER